MWSNGNLEILNKKGEAVSISYWCKHYDEPSFYGINEGRISKLELRQDGRCVYNFDREPDLEPQTEEAAAALEILIKKFN